MADIDNMQAWAITQGYDPTYDYRAANKPPPPGYLSEHFKASEFACKHCGSLGDAGIDPDLVSLLETVRSHFADKPVTINSGYRCPTHNKAVGGASQSQHLRGTAADITVKGVSPSTVYAYLDPWHDGGLGKYSTFTHVDVRDGRARWSG